MCTLSLLHLIYFMGWSDIVFWPKHWFACISEVTTFNEKSEAAWPYILLTWWFSEQRLVIQAVCMWLIVIPKSRLHLLFLVYLLASYYAKSGSQEASCAQAAGDLWKSNYFVSLPPRADWKQIGWDRKLSSEEKKQSYKNSK